MPESNVAALISAMSAIVTDITFIREQVTMPTVQQGTVVFELQLKGWGSDLGVSMHCEVYASEADCI